MTSIRLKIETVQDLVEYLEGIPTEFKVGKTNVIGELVLFDRGEIEVRQSKDSKEGYVSFGLTTNVTKIFGNEPDEP